MNIFFLMLSFFLFTFRATISLPADDFLNDITLYINELCSHNGIPILDKENNSVTCQCEDKYTDEPRENLKKYINGHFIHCSYERKRRFLTFFLAALCPMGLDYFYLEHYGFFALFFFLFILNIAIIIISIGLNYKLEKKEEEEKRKKKDKKENFKIELKNITKINKGCVRFINIISKVLLGFLIIFWIFNTIFQGLGFIPDKNKVFTENDMGYLFQVAEK